MTDNKLYLIGLSPDLDWLPPAVSRIIAQAEILAGGQRLLELFPEHQGQKMPLTLPLNDWLGELETLRREGCKIAVLTSGDPGHFGLSRALTEVIDRQEVVTIPSPTVVQQAFARLGVSWNGSEVVSLHGREGLGAFWGAVYRASHFSGSGYLAVYTDAKNTPEIIAKRLLGRGQQQWRMTVFEDLGAADERISSWSLFEAKLRRFSPLNLVVLECLKKAAQISLGMPEESFIHEAGLITKSEVRAATLGGLELHPTHTLWDLGAGSGSVAIEAAGLLHHGAVWAVEKSPLRSEQIAANRAYFGAAQVEIVEDDAMAAIGHLPEPDRVFIGGGGKDLPAIIKSAAAKLKSRGVMVANMVSVHALGSAMEAMQEAGLEVSVTQIQASRSEPLGGSIYLRPLNQVWMVKGRRGK